MPNVCFNFILCFYRKIWLERIKFLADELIGQPFGYTFEVQNEHLVKVSHEGDIVGEVEKDNGKGTVISNFGFIHILFHKIT